MSKGSVLYYRHTLGHCRKMSFTYVSAPEEFYVLVKMNCIWYGVPRLTKLINKRVIGPQQLFAYIVLMSGCHDKVSIKLCQFNVCVPCACKICKDIADVY
jgi:hypothetical protein